MPIYYIANAFEFIFNYYIIKTILQKPLKPKLVDFLFWIIHASSSIIFEHFPIGGFTSNIVILLLFIYVYEKANMKRLILIYSIYYLIVELIQEFITLCMGILHLDFEAWYIYYIGNISTLLLAIFLFRIPHARDILSILERSSKLYQIIVINYTLFWMGFQFIDKLNGSTSYMGYYAPYIVAIFLFVMVVINLVFIYYEKQLNLAEQRLQIYQTQLPIYDSLVSEIRASQHEYRNRLQSLQNLPLLYHDYESLTKALQSYTDGYSKPLNAYTLLCINMPLLAASLYHLTCIADRQHITISFDIESNDIISHATEYELRDYTSVILQNAIEACTAGDHIYVRITCSDGNLYYEVRNPSRRKYSYEEIALFFKKGYTTKKNSSKHSLSIVPHGYGLYAALQNVTKQGGSICCDSVEKDGSYFTCFLLIV